MIIKASRTMSTALYRNTNYECTKLITRRYSTSFSMGILAFSPKFRKPIYGIYAYVRYADEIVDTFHDYDKVNLFREFREETFKAIRQKIHLNPVLDAFQDVVNMYGVDHELINAFLDSMEMDLEKTTYSARGYEEYIYGSAEVVGLMCLRVFCEGDSVKYSELKASARSLGAAFQKVNFLRDLKDDYQDRGRTYFPGVNFQLNFNQETKQQIETDIQRDLDSALSGIRRLPSGAKSGVYLAFLLYQSLFKKLKQATPSEIMESRVRVPNSRKFALIPVAYFRTRFGHV